MKENVKESAVRSKPFVGITMGDPNGIGPEVIIKALRDHRIFNYITPIIYGAAEAISFYKKRLDYDKFRFMAINNTNDIAEKNVNVWDLSSGKVAVSPGKFSEAYTQLSIRSLKTCTEHLKKGLIDCMVTGPIHKKYVKACNFDYVGHTEFLTESFGRTETESMMLMVSDKIRIGLATVHIPINQLAHVLTKHHLRGKIDVLIKTLQEDFAIMKPRIAVLGINPHAGEEGILGEEEATIIKPILDEYRARNFLLFGPYSSDAFFGSVAYRQYDAVLAMYHDQALIPFKMLSFHSGVNYTAGLPVVRTSPSHGTAYPIAGLNEASYHSMQRSIFVAHEIWKRRKNQ